MSRQKHITYFIFIFRIFTLKRVRFSLSFVKGERKTIREGNLLSNVYKIHSPTLHKFREIFDLLRERSKSKVNKKKEPLQTWKKNFAFVAPSTRDRRTRTPSKSDARTEDHIEGRKVFLYSSK